MSGVNEVTWAEFVAVCSDLFDLKRDLAIAETALEAERQWRLTSLPALLAAEARALQAEARCAELEAAVTRELTTQFPELRPHAALINAYHETTERP